MFSGIGDIAEHGLKIDRIVDLDLVIALEHELRMSGE
jgi:hypothetical protein